MCDGQGRTPTHEKIDIEVPAGIASGRQLRVRGYGEAGFRGAAAGDLIVTVQVAEHERFQRSGDDLYCMVEVPMASAALGCTVEVEGILDGERIEVAVPAGTQYGDTVTVENRGMPRAGGGGSRGRLVARIAVTVPRKMSPAAREALERFAREMGENPTPKKSVGDRIRDAIDDILE